MNRLRKTIDRVQRPLNRHGIGRRQLLCAVASLAMMSLSGNLTAGEAKTGSEPAWNVREHLPMGKVIVQSHRGAGELAPENTIEAFELGWKLGTYPESDLRTTSDGVIVTFHDGNFSRVVRDVSPSLKKKGVADVTWDQLKKMDVGGYKGDHFEGRHVSTISDVFKVMQGKPERHLYMDIKNVDFDQLAAEVKKYGVEKQVVLASTKYEQIRQWKKLIPQSDTLLWMGGTEQELAERFEELRKTNFADVTQLQIHVRDKSVPKPKSGEEQKTSTPDVSKPDPFLPTDNFLRKAGDELRQHGIVLQTLPYGMANAAVYHKLMDLGVMSFATDYPDVTMDAIRSYYAEASGGGTKAK